jgi:formate dehydrogenase beta subunit
VNPLLIQRFAMIVQRLREIQNRFGFLPDAELKRLAADSGVPLYRIEEVSSFFPAFKLERTDPRR